MKKCLLVIFILLDTLYADKSNALEMAFESTFGKDIMIDEKVLILGAKDKQRLQAKASAKIDMTKVRFYTVNREKSAVGYGVLMVQTIRTKKAAILYLIEKDGTIKSIEILLFKEPSEYKPSKSWQSLFAGKTLGDNLVAGDGLPTISGATLSAKAVSKAARIALAIVSEYK